MFTQSFFGFMPFNRRVLPGLGACPPFRWLRICARGCGARPAIEDDLFLVWSSGGAFEAEAVKPKYVTLLEAWTCLAPEQRLKRWGLQVSLQPLHRNHQYTRISPRPFLRMVRHGQAYQALNRDLLIVTCSPPKCRAKTGTAGLGIRQVTPRTSASGYHQATLLHQGRLGFHQLHHQGAF